MATPIHDLSEALNVPIPQVANWNMVPLGLVLDLADFFSVDLDGTLGTAEERLRIVIDEADLRGAAGEPLIFGDGHSVNVAAAIAERVRDEQRHRATTRRRERPARLAQADARWKPARKKIEAVNRISALTDSGAETLGPGSKERKSVLTNLHRGLGFGPAPDLTKSRLGAVLAERLDVDWDRTCHSTGETITLTGLNRLLYAASAKLDATSAVADSLSVNEEATLYSGTILQSILLDNAVIDDASIDDGPSAVWDGRTSVQTMLTEKFRHARQTEWPGWFFEYCALDALASSFGGGPVLVGGTEFDYRGIRTWDLKTHSEPTGRGANTAPLNDKDAMVEAVGDGGLGFMMLCGRPEFENEHDFWVWHNEVVREKEPHERSAKSRRLKTAFALVSLDFYFIESLAELERLEHAGIVTPFNQGRQQSGAARKVKYQMDVNKAREDPVLLRRILIPEYLAELTDPADLAG